MIGRRLSHYVIVEPLGEGGMGVVYRAHDQHLDRDVAIKVLPPGTLDDEVARRRFRREAMALSRLQHPNINTVHDFDAQEGVDFLVMELVPGVTLAERLAAGPLPEAEVVRLGLQIAGALEAAHEHGVIHRDLKPGNIMVTPGGEAKVLDFGLAKRLEPSGTAPGPDAARSATLTASGEISGTVPYMAPEQLLAGKVDGRADLWAVGIMLYEMVVGARPFPDGPAPRLMYAILSGPVTFPQDRPPTVSPGLQAVILRCLEQQAERRYANGTELLADLRALAARGGTAPAGPDPAPGRSPARQRGVATSRATRLGVGAALTVALIAATMLGFNLGGIRSWLIHGGAAPETAPSLAVLPLANLSGDPSQEFFADGMTDELITRLAQVSALRVISRSSVMPYKGTQKSLAQIARELHVRMVVEGTVARGGDLVRIAARLVEVASGRPVWAESYERTLSNVLTIQSDVARAIVQEVRAKVTPEERGRLAAAPQVDPAAHEAYLRGRSQEYKFTGEGFRKAAESYNRALALDPRYAAAYAGLANTYAYMSGMFLSAHEAMGRARAAALRAIEIDPYQAEAHSALAYVKMVYDWDRPGAEQDYLTALKLAPSDPTAHLNYGNLLISMGRFNEAAVHLRRVQEADPLSALASSCSLWPLLEGRRYAEAAAAARTVVIADPNAQNARMVLGQALFYLGSRTEGVAEVRRASESDPGNPFPLGWLGHLSGLAGQRAQARDVLRRLEELRKKQYVQPYLFAIVHIGLGEKARALDLLEQALEERSDELFFANVDPALDPLRSEPRFRAILKTLRFRP